MLKGEEHIIAVFHQQIRAREDLSLFLSTAAGEAVVNEAQDQWCTLLGKLAVVDCTAQGWEDEVKQTRRELDVVVLGLTWMNDILQKGKVAQATLKSMEETTEEY